MNRERGRQGGRERRIARLLNNKEEQQEDMACAEARKCEVKVATAKHMAEHQAELVRQRNGQEQD